VKVSELQALETETIEVLRKNIATGDPEAARVLLEHLRATSKAISEWQKSRDIGNEPRNRKNEKP
jgi:hypothetical protein